MRPPPGVMGPPPGMFGPRPGMMGYPGGFGGGFGPFVHGGFPGPRPPFENEIHSFSAANQEGATFGATPEELEFGVLQSQEQGEGDLGRRGIFAKIKN